MRRALLPGEQTIVVTRPQGRSLVWPSVVFVLAPALCAYAAALLRRKDLAATAPALADSRDSLTLALLAATVLVLLFFCLRRLLEWAGTRYLLTTRRLIARRGLLRRSEQQYPLAAVRSLDCRQSLLQRFLRSGNLVMDLGAEGSRVLADVPEVDRFRAIAVEAIEDLPQTAMFDGYGAAGPFEGPGPDGRQGPGGSAWNRTGGEAQ